MANSIASLSEYFARKLGWEIKSSGSKKQGTSSKEVIPVRPEDGGKVELPDTIQQLLDRYLSRGTTEALNTKTRFQRYMDILAMYNDYPRTAKDRQNLINEALNVDEDTLPFDVEAKGPMKQDILDLWADTGMYEKAHAICSDMEGMGDSGCILSYNKDNTGISKVIPITPFQLTERIEFLPFKVEEEIQRQGSTMGQLVGSNSRIRDLVDAIKNDEDFSQAFEERLFGFVVGKYAMPPWRFIHFRRLTNEDPFYPFGKPAHIDVWSSYVKWDVATRLMSIARGANFPVDNYTINLPATTDVVTKAMKARELIQALLNNGLMSTRKEKTGIGEAKVSIKDTVTYEQIKPSMSMNEVDDVAMLKENIDEGLYSPRGYFDATSSFGAESGVALVQKHKPFAREVRMGVQYNFMQGLKLMTDIHLLLKGYKAEELDYLITMPYPVVQADRDSIQSQMDLLNLANSMLDSLRDKIGGSEGDALPIDLVRIIYKKFLPYNDEKIEDMIKTFDQKKDTVNVRYVDPDKEPGSDNYAKPADIVSEKFIEFVWTKKGGQTEKKGKKLTEAQLKEAVEESIITRLQEHVVSSRKINGKHYYSSRNKHPDYDPSFFIKNTKKRLTERNMFKKFSYREKVDIAIPEEFKEYQDTNKTKYF